MEIALGTLKEKGDELIAFLEPRVGVKPSRSGDTLEIDEEAMRKGLKKKQVKTYIKRFLFMNNVRKRYRVLVSGSELTIQELEISEEAEEKEEEAKEKREAAKEEKTETKEEGK